MATQTFDDRDSAVIYSSGWRTAGSAYEFDGTTSYTSDPGLTARFSFRGTVVAVYGTIGSQQTPQSSYSVDGGTPVVFRATQSNDIQYGSRFFQSSRLSNGQHTLTVTSLSNSTLFLDAFTVLVPDDASSSSSVVSSSSGSNIANRASSTIDSARSSVMQSSSSTKFVTVVVTSHGVGASSSATPDANLGGKTDTSKPNNIPIIAGACIGAALGILLLAVIAFILLRRQKRREENSRVISAFFNTPPPFEGAERSNRMLMSQVTSGESFAGPLSPSRSASYNYQTSSHSAQDAYAINAFIEPHVLQSQQVPSYSSAVAPYQTHGYDHHAAHPPPNYPSGEYPLYGQGPFADPGGYALPSKLLNEYQYSGAAASNGQ